MAGGALDAFVDDSLVTGYHINQNSLFSLIIAAEADQAAPLRIAVRNDWPPHALAIINKAIDSITIEDRNQIQQRWGAFVLAQGATREADPIESKTGTADAGTLQTMTRAVVIQGVILVVTVLAVLGLLLFIIQRYFNHLFTRWLESKKIAWIGPVMLALFLITIILITQVALNTIEQQTRNNAAQSLQTVVQSTYESLLVWVENRKASIKQLTQDPQLVAQTQRHLLVPPQKADLIESDSLANLRLFFESKRDKYGDVGFFIINPDNINIASMRDTNLGWQNLIAEQRPAVLQRAFAGETVFVPPVTTDVAINTDRKTNISKSSTMFFAAPITDRLGKVIAVLTLRFDPTRDFARLIGVGRFA